MLKKYPNLKVFIAGYSSADLKLEIKIKAKIKKLGIEHNVNLFTNVDHITKIEFLKSLKIFIFPSYLEGWALNVMEAAYTGEPIIAYKLPAYSYLDGNYFPVRPGDMDGLSKKQNLYFQITTWQKKITEAAKNSATNYDYRKIALDQLLDLPIS